MQAANVTGPNGESVIGDPDASHQSILSSAARAADNRGGRSCQLLQVPVSHMHFPGYAYQTFTSSDPPNFYQPQPYGYYPSYYPIAAESPSPTNSSGQTSPDFPHYSTLYNPYSTPIAYYPGSYVKERPYFEYPVVEQPNQEQHEENISSSGDK